MRAKGRLLQELLDRRGGAEAGNWYIQAENNH